MKTVKAPTLKKPSRVQLPDKLIKGSFCDKDDCQCLVGFLINKAGISKSILRNSEPKGDDGITYNLCENKNSKQKMTTLSIMRKVYGWNSTRVSNTITKNDCCSSSEERIQLLKSELDKLGIKYYKAKS
jgi:hypothetical protein